jgi:hypothetical protein
MKALVCACPDYLSARVTDDALRCDLGDRPRCVVADGNRERFAPTRDRNGERRLCDDGNLSGIPGREAR